MNKIVIACFMCAAFFLGQTSISSTETIVYEYGGLIDNSISECETKNSVGIDDGNKVSNKDTEETTQESQKSILLKDVKLTAYCKEPHAHICNNGDANNTATMTVPTTGRTIAVDPTVIPYGARVNINGKTYIAEDSGGSIKGNRIDILFETHQEALEFGIQYADVVVEV